MIHLYYVECKDNDTEYGILCACLDKEDANFLAEHVMGIYNLSTSGMKYNALSGFNESFDVEGYFYVTKNPFSPDLTYFESLRNENFKQVSVRKIKIDKILENL